MTVIAHTHTHTHTKIDVEVSIPGNGMLSLIQPVRFVVFSDSSRCIYGSIDAPSPGSTDAPKDIGALRDLEFVSGAAFAGDELEV